MNVKQYDLNSYNVTSSDRAPLILA